MNQTVKQLIPAIASFAKDKGVYLSKTKLLKLLYLFDVEYYRLHRSTFTGFPWKFFHLGPWTNEFDPLLETLVREGAVIATQNPRPDFESTNYLPADEQDIGTLFPDIHDDFAIRRVLKAWIERPVGEILDHVYFHTEPMERAVRNTPLDFSVIPAQQPERYARASSHTSPGEAARIRRAFKERQMQLRAQQASPTIFTPPRYDEEFFQAMAKLDVDPA